MLSGTVQVIRGPDNSPNSSNLRFTSTNRVSVIVNGVIIDPSGYSLDVVNQQIIFSPAIYESNNVVNVIVYNDLTSNIDNASVISLEFDVLDPTVSADLGFLSSSAWGDYNAVNIPGVGLHYLMHCTDLSALVKDTSYGVRDLTVVSHLYVDPITVLPSEFHLLLARDPYSFQDKELNAYLNGAVFDSSFSFTYSQDQTTGVYNLTVPQSKLAQLLSSMIPTAQIDPLLFTSASTSGATTVVSTLTHKYIIGPT